MPRPQFWSGRQMVFDGGDGDSFAVGDVEEIVVFGLAIPTLAAESDLRRVSRGAADDDILLSLKHNYPGQLVVTISQQDRAADANAIHSGKQFIHGRDTNDFSLRRRQGRGLGKPRWGRRDGRHFRPKLAGA